MQGSGKCYHYHSVTLSHRRCVFTSADKTLAVEDVRQFDTYEDGMIIYCA